MYFNLIHESPYAHYGCSPPAIVYVKGETTNFFEGYFDIDLEFYLQDDDLLSRDD